MWKFQSNTAKLWYYRGSYRLFFAPQTDNNNDDKNWFFILFWSRAEKFVRFLW